MKKFIRVFCILFIGSVCFYAANAQSKTNKHQATVMAAVGDKNFVFVADYVSPQRGAGHALTYEYDLTVNKDSVIVYLPYFGRAYLANYSGNDDGIKFTSTKFDYTATTSKKGNMDILITPKDQDLSDPLGVKSMRLDISPDGYASLQIINYNRDAILFNGTIQERKRAKNI